MTSAGRLFLSGLCGWVTLGEASLGEGTRAALPPSPSVQAQVVELLNQRRAACTGNGCPLPPLKLVSVLAGLAEEHSGSMARGDFFSHCDPATGREPWERMQAAGYDYSAAAENIAGGSSTPAATMAQWMGNPVHRASILSREFREVGVGHFRQEGDRANVLRDGNGDCDCRDRGETCHGAALTDYWTQLFGRRDEAYPLVIAGERQVTPSATVEIYVHGPRGAKELRLRNDGESWSEWRAFASRVKWVLASGDGRRTVFSEVRTGSEIRRACDEIWRTGAGRPSAASESVVCDANGAWSLADR